MESWNWAWKEPSDQFRCNALTQSQALSYCIRYLLNTWPTGERQAAYRRSKDSYGTGLKAQDSHSEEHYQT